MCRSDSASRMARSERVGRCISRLAGDLFKNEIERSVPVLLPYQLVCPANGIGGLFRYGFRAVPVLLLPNQTSHPLFVGCRAGVQWVGNVRVFDAIECSGKSSLPDKKVHLLQQP